MRVPPPCGIRDTVLVGPDGNQGHPTCTLPAGHGIHEEIQDGKLMAQWSGGKPSEAMSDNGRATIVAQTLRWLAEQPWIDEADARDALAEIAADIEHNADNLNYGTCPVCEEITCDTTCPLAPARSTER